MHFGLYAFDLFLEIYREAWAWEQQQGPGSLDVSTQSDAGLKPLSQTYDDEAAYLRDVPRLIIEHNIYGVDIDPRAAQIATLALWLRAQRAWHDADMKAHQRPIIGQGHVVAAIAPPAEKNCASSFLNGWILRMHSYSRKVCNCYITCLNWVCCCRWSGAAQVDKASLRREWK